MARVEKRKLGYYAVLDVPRTLQGKIGKKQLVQSLKTTDRVEAAVASRQVFVDLQQIIEAARRPPGETLTPEADQWRAALEAARHGEEVVTGRDADEQGQEAALRGHLDDRAKAIAAKHGHAAAAGFYAVASGRATPLLHHLDDWLIEGGQKGAFAGRTKLGHRRALAVLQGWMKEAKIATTIEAIRRREAGRFVTECLVKSGRHPKTIASVISVCRSYWTFLDRKGVLAADKTNPWDGQAPSKGASKGTDETVKRPFTHAELRRLLTGPADAELADLMRVAALTGMRIEEIYRLAVSDCGDGWFKVRRAKSKAGQRRVPIHSALTEIVARRCKDKGASAYFFHEAGPLKEDRERSMAASKRFGHYRKRATVAVDDAVKGKRQSLITFHSFRHWFITEAGRAGQIERVIQQVVGHKGQSMTNRVYFHSDLDPALRACVEAVQLPPIPPSSQEAL